MTAPVILEWRNLNLVIKKRELKISKCKTLVEERRILENGNKSIIVLEYFAAKMWLLLTGII